MGMTQELRPATSDDLAAVEGIVRAAYATYIARIGREPGPMLDEYAAAIGAGRMHVGIRDGVVRGILVRKTHKNSREKSGESNKHGCERTAIRTPECSPKAPKTGEICRRNQNVFPARKKIRPHEAHRNAPSQFSIQL